MIELCTRKVKCMDGFRWACNKNLYIGLSSSSTNAHTQKTSSSTLASLCVFVLSVLFHRDSFYSILSPHSILNIMHRAVEVVGYNAEEPWEACRVTSCRETPVPGPFQVLVRVLCRPVNPSDVLGLKGQYPGWRPNHFPSIPGLEGMGIISQVTQSQIKPNHFLFSVIHSLFGPCSNSLPFLFSTCFCCCFELGRRECEPGASWATRGSTQ